MYKNIIFDLYGTIIDLETDENLVELWQKLSFLYQLYGALYSPETLKKEYHMKVCELLDENPGNSIYPDVDIRDVFSHLFIYKSIKPNDQMIEAVQSNFRDLSSLKLLLYPKALETLGILSKRRRGLYILSNGQRIFSIMELQRLNIFDYFKGLHFSSDYKISKPDPGIFIKMLMSEHLDPKETVFIGNDMINDISGAIGVNLDTIYIHTNHSPPIDKNCKFKPTYSIVDGDFSKILEYI